MATFRTLNAVGEPDFSSDAGSPFALASAQAGAVQQPGNPDQAVAFTGTDGNDTLYGSQRDDTLNGGAGDDEIHTGRSKISGLGDQVSGGDGNDKIYVEYFPFPWGNWPVVLWNHGTANFTNHLDGGRGNDTFVMAWNGDYVMQVRPNDAGTIGIKNEIHGGEGVDTVDYSDWGPTYDGYDLGAWINLGTGESVLRYSGEAAKRGRHVVDTLDSIENAIGTQGNDGITGETGANLLEGREGDDTLKGEGGNDTLLGGAGNDLIYDGAGNDVVDAGDGDDIVRSTLAWEVNSFDGGAGNDTLDYSAAAYPNGRINPHDGQGGYRPGVWVDLEAKSAWRFKLGIEFDGSKTGMGTESGLPDSIRGFENVIGSDLNDRLVGDSGDNRLDGGAGNDVVLGGAGNDLIYDGAGNDLIYDGAGNDVVDAGDGNDTVRSSLAWEVNTFKGGAGNDTLDYSAEAYPNGRMNYDNGQGGYQYGIWVDLRVGTAKRYYLGMELNGGMPDSISGFENVIGSDLKDRLDGDAGANRLEGGRGNDTLYGWDGNDTLAGGDGNDVLEGGSGADRFVFDTAVSAANKDVIVDFKMAERDVIALDDAIFTRLTGKTDLSRYFRLASKNADGDDYLVYDVKNGQLAYDASGNGSALQVFATLNVNTVPKLDASAFVVI